MEKLNGLIVLGFGGHARAIADIAIACRIHSFIFVDANARDDEHFQGNPVLRDLPSSINAHWACVPALGDNLKREQQMLIIEEMGWPIISLIAPSSTIGVGATIAPGSVVGHHAHVGPMASIGRGCIINNGAIVEHECQISNFTHVAVNATIAGRSSIGEYGFIGAGAVVIDGINVCKKVTVGAGAIVVKNINQSGVYVGIPAKIL